MVKVVWKVYTQSFDYFYEDVELSWEEDNEEEYDTLDEAELQAEKDKYGWRGTLVEVWVDNSFYREYEVE